MKPKIDPKLLIPGDVLHCTANSFLARAIQLFSRSRINHSAFVVQIEEILYVIDADRHGTNPKLLDYWIEKEKYSYIVSRPDPNVYDIAALQKKAFSLAGHTPYDFASLLRYQLIYQLTGKWKGKQNAEAKEKLYCSEFIAYIFDMEAWYSCSPQDVFNFMLNSINFKIVNS